MFADFAPFATVPGAHDVPSLYDIECKPFLVPLLVEGVTAGGVAEEVEFIGVEVRAGRMSDPPIAGITRIRPTQADSCGVHVRTPYVKELTHQ